ncbi:hypothetical protein CONPUDRAFT_122044 [Coniophora puteana RWD-64-598 SS2]|uniref:C2H2-type domain-containing protein n=1 Tax=Coniophora puteana (strain RWD-64-598) TaxID=741705 RepID=A0A5M3MWD8_CONPW|nr:uncharacterized protein CONPUDRAFT_122044 [Coniophora puteana RWD-64-598 SS2]EIW83463.1 hypothetical protein CONPUDRAFT_122044 [Coniophora puteana RWD-64-598 SS2]
MTDTPSDENSANVLAIPSFPEGQFDGEEWGEDGDDYEDEDYEDDEDPEEIARRLNEQLLADISRAQAESAQASVQAGTSNNTTASTGHDPIPLLPDPSVFINEAQASASALSESNSARKHEAAIKTMRAILDLTSGDSLARSALASTSIPNSDDNLLSALQNISSAGSVPKDLARALSHVLVSLARSDALFANLRHSNAPAMQLDLGKRKRDDAQDPAYAQPQAMDVDSRPFKRPALAPPDLQSQIAEAVHVVGSTLTTVPTDRPLDPALISSIQAQLHQIFLFAVTSSSGGGPEMGPLQEIGGLIQAIGVISGTHIGPPAPHPPHPHDPHLNPWGAPPPQHGDHLFTDLTTAVYPCLHPACTKTFARLYSLRAHARMHTTHRPFRCAACPAAFARNHDLKRHTHLHDRRGWQCGGCAKLFSRRDAIKRHKNASAARADGSGAQCVEAEVREVELDREGDEEDAKEGRRARMWSDIAAVSGAPPGGGFVPFDGGTVGGIGGPEEGEISREVVGRGQAAVMSLHGLLQARVSSALGAPVGQGNPLVVPPPPPQYDPSIMGGQATLASIIARAQAQPPPAVPPASAAQPIPSIEAPPVDVAGSEQATSGGSTAQSLALLGLSEEQAKLLEQAIAHAASAAQAQAEAEAAMEEEEEDYEDDEDATLDGEGENMAGEAGA